MKSNKKFLLTLALGTCLVTSSWASHLSDDEKMAAQLALSKRVTEVSGQLQNNYDRWWTDFENGTNRKLENVPAYLNRLAHRDRDGVEAAAWLMAGGKYGLCNPVLNEQQRNDLWSAKNKVFTAEADLIKAGKPGFLKDIQTAFKTGEMVLKDLIAKVDRLTGRVSTLESESIILKREIANIPLLIKQATDPLNAEILKINNDLNRVTNNLNKEREDRKKETDRLLKQINEKDKKVEINDAVEKAVKNIKSEYLTEKQDRETAFEKALSEERRVHQATIDSFKSLSETYERKALSLEDEKVEYLKKEAERKAADEKKEAETQVTILKIQLESTQKETRMLEQMNQMLKNENEGIKQELANKINAYNELKERYDIVMEKLMILAHFK
jgi:DNA repair exonuclease SbcCD ATPase subunit